MNAASNRVQKSSYSGVLISFEGGEGSGKSSQIDCLLNHLVGLGYEPVLVRNPGSSQIGQKIRQILLDPSSSSICIKTEVFLHAASLHQNLKTIILPALEEGRIVICDRYVDSAIAYQGIGRGIGEKFVREVVLSNALEDIVPDVTLLLDLPESMVQVRTHGNRQDNESRIENEPTEFHSAVRLAYLALANRYPDRIKIIRANQAFEQVSKDILDVVLPWISPDR